MIIFLSILPHLIFTQPPIQWEMAFGGTSFDIGRSVQETADGGYIIAGITASFGAGIWDVYFIKTDDLGNLLWEKTYGGADWDAGYSVDETSDDGYIIAGGTYSFGAGDGDVYLIKTDTAGNFLWQKTFGDTSNDWAYSVQETNDGGFIIAGHTASFGAGSWDVYLVKTDLSGNLSWQKAYGGASSEDGFSVQQTADEGYIIAGITASFGAGDWDIYLIKTDASGDALWTKTFGGDTTDYCYSVQETNDGGYIAAGYTTSFGAGGEDVYVIKTDTSGNVLWTKTFGDANNERGFAVQQTSDGGYIIGAFTNSFGSGNYDVYLIKTDASGDTIWTKTYGRAGDDRCHSIQQTADNGYIIAGQTKSFGPGVPAYPNVYLIKTEPDIGIKEDLPRKVIPSFPEILPIPTFFKETISLRFRNPAPRPLKILLYSIYGNLILEKNYSYIPGSLHLKDERIKKLTSGIYFLLVSSGNKRLGRFKLIKF